MSAATSFAEQASTFTLTFERWRVTLEEEGVCITYGFFLDWVAFHRKRAIQAALHILAIPLHPVPIGGLIGHGDGWSLQRAAEGSLVLQRGRSMLLGPQGSFVHMTAEDAENIAIAIIELAG